MVENTLDHTIKAIIQHWSDQNIPLMNYNMAEIQSIIAVDIKLIPKDFIKFYNKVNGMKTLFPNDIDNEGFLFYPIEAIKSVQDEFECGDIISNNNIFIFAEFMHKSWWYGFQIKNENDYLIGIIPSNDIFKPITNRLEEFLLLYLKDSEVLYNYS